MSLVYPFAAQLPLYLCHTFESLIKLLDRLQRKHVYREYLLRESILFLLLENIQSGLVKDVLHDFQRAGNAAVLGIDVDLSTGDVFLDKDEAAWFEALFTPLEKVDEVLYEVGDGDLSVAIWNRSSSSPKPTIRKMSKTPLCPNRVVFTLLGHKILEPLANVVLHSVSKLDEVFFLGRFQKSRVLLHEIHGFEDFEEEYFGNSADSGSTVLRRREATMRLSSWRIAIERQAIAVSNSSLQKNQNMSLLNTNHTRVLREKFEEIRPRHTGQ